MKRISNVLLLVFFSSRCVSGEVESLPRHAQFGINGHPFSQSGYFDISLEKQLNLVAESGARWYRVDISTENFQASTARLDELIRLSEARGIQLLPVLISSSGARSPGGTLHEIREFAAQFARKIAGRYRGRITHWELSNELDDYCLIKKGETTRSGKHWEWGDPDGSHADDYEEARYQRAKAEILGLADGVKSVDPAARTIVDTAGWLHYGFIDRLVSEDRVPFDILSWHWYSEMGDITRVEGGMDLASYLQRFGKPLWLTEVGRRGGSASGKEHEQAQYMALDLKALAANPQIGGLFVYELLDEPYFGEAGESHYGVVTLGRGPDGRWAITGRKEAFEALSRTAHR
ncbi:MAG TPA: glycosyl hydrolase [Opitutaceae bacterium]|nr:glycosyl hydrolase [Opitutaceae bacterium]